MSVLVLDEYPKVDLDEFLPELLLEIPELPEDILRSYVRNAAIEFAKRSLVFQRDVHICTQVCVENYILEAPDCVDIVGISGICSDTCHDITRLSNAPCHVPCISTHSWWERPSTLWVSPSPSTPTKLVVKVIVAPSMDACELDAAFYSVHKDAVQDGARARLYAIPRRPWSSQPLADTYKREFEKGISEAGVDRLLGGQVGARRIRTLWNSRR